MTEELKNWFNNKVDEIAKKEANNISYNEEI